MRVLHRGQASLLRWSGWAVALSSVAIAAFLAWEGSRATSGVSPTTSWTGVALVLMFGGGLMVICRLSAAYLAARRQADTCARKLTERTAKTRAIVDTAADGIVTLDERGVIESFNAAAESMFGYNAEEVIGKNVKLLLPKTGEWPDDELITHRPAGGKVAGFGRRREHDGRRKDGTVLPVEVAVSELNLPDRKLFTGVFHDLSRHKRSEEALVKSERFLQTVIDEIPEPLMVVGRDHEIILANRAVRETAGGQDPVSGRLRCYQASHHRDEPCQDEQHPCPLREVISTRKPTVVMHTHFDAAGNELLMEIIAAPIFSESGEVIQVIESCRDITARVRAEDSARQRQAELAHVARLATMGEMAGGLAHELNQPLFAIVNYLQACRERIRAGSGDANGLLEDLSQAAAQAERASNVIEHIRMFLRKEKLQRASVNLNNLVRDAISLMGAELRRNGTTLHLALGESLPAVRAVPLQLEQVVVNLIQNGLDTMKDTGANDRLLTIRTTMGKHGGVEFSIHDTGAGLPDGETERIFDPFFTTKSNGMGMGLSIARSILEAHAGRLWATPGRDVGTTFLFSLPASHGDGNNGK